jgi:segregation and condensation protein B
MDFDTKQAIIEAMMFSTGGIVTIQDIMRILEIGSSEIETVMLKLREKYEKPSSGIELLKIDDGYQLCTKKEYYEYIYPLIDKRTKPNISNSALETLAIIAYNPKITRAEIEAIRGVNADGTIYKLLEYNLIEEAGRLDAPGRPNTYKTTKDFLKMFGISSLEELPELPRYKLDENEQIVLDEILSPESEETVDNEYKKEEVKEENN